MIIGYSTNAYGKYPLLEAVADIAGIGFKGIEIVCKPPHFSPLEPADGIDEALSSVLKRAGLAVTNINGLTLFADSDHHLPAEIHSPEERRRIRVDHSLRSLRLAARLGCPNLSLPSGEGVPDCGPADLARRILEALEPVLPLAEALGVSVLIEPEPAFARHHGRHMAALLAEFASHRIGLNFDAGHFFCAGLDPACAFEELFPWIRHVHLEDIAPDRSHRHLIPGRGAMDFLALFRSMARLGYQGNLCLELYTYQDTPSEAGREGLRHLLPLLASAGLTVTTADRMEVLNQVRSRPNGPEKPESA